ncbi:hypothetical protein K435DRAFT_688687 [Dendrothele bispora CBS 962.96]|uniref:Bacteriophage T5 Orf172 DNA-binding domain-containing protein n=1 Tax=Dendrothele bispora (strain CBS 962.96) TaxID=1314807 RepID=A0A4V4HCM0_DENBC|nr:hypothetical protein K435DRAFT_688687 [Dendrothele bispora CBS 962.96]
MSSYPEKPYISQEKLVHTVNKPISPADEAGLIYCFKITDDATANDTSFLFKIGRTRRPIEERQKEWDKRCSSNDHQWYDPVRVSYCHRIERLVHLSLDSAGIERVRDMCPDCHVRHVEIFRLSDENAWNTIIEPLIIKMNAIA